MNFLEIAREILDANDGASGLLSIEDLVPQDIRRLKNNINLAYNTIKLDLGYKDESAETETTLVTVAGQESYNFPNGLTSIHQLQTNLDPPLRIIPWTEYERFKASDTLVRVESFPDIASIYGRKIYLYPVPDTAYTFNVRGKSGFVPLVNNTDEPDLPAELHRVIRELALFYEMDYENNPRAGSQQARALEMLRLAKLNLRQHMEEPARIVTRRELRQINKIRRILQK